MRHLVALSGGKDSTAMALFLREREPENDYEFICTPTGDELPEMLEHWKRLGSLLGRPLRPVTSGRSLAGLIRGQNALPNWRMRWCTRMLKIEPFERFVLEARPCTIYVGIRADETDSRDGIKWEETAEGISRRYPLVEWGWGIGDVMGYLEKKGIEIPRRTDCGSCFFQTLYEWYELWRSEPGRYETYCQWEDGTGHTLRSEGRDAWPANLRLLAEEFSRGRIPKRRTAMKDRKAMCSVCAR